VENKTDSDLIFIEVQTGSYFGEDDIVRVEDDYERPQ
jgi:mannose-6-phosphate isomerase